MMPGPVDPINIYSQLGGNSSVIIPFKNPTDRQVIVDVVMKERLFSRSGKLSVNCRNSSLDLTGYLMFVVLLIIYHGQFSVVFREMST